MPILQWLDRERHVKSAESMPYRLLEADDAHSAGDAETSNMLIQGDNLEALKALLPSYAVRVKCIFIDPPYNTRSAFEHYDDFPIESWSAGSGKFARPSPILTGE
jgi:adenine-specific DNA-methyltransferase